MNTNSPVKSTEEFKKEYEPSLEDTMNLNAHENKEEFGVAGLNNESEVPHDESQFYSNAGYSSPSMPLCVVSEEGAQSTLMESNSVGSPIPVTKSEEMTGVIEPNSGINGAECKTSDYATEGEVNHVKDYQEDELLDTDAGATVNYFAETEGLNQHLNNPLDQGDDDHFNSIDRDCYVKHSEESSAPVEVVNGDCGQGPVYSQPEEIEVNEEMDYKSLNRKSNYKSEVTEDHYSSEKVPPENEAMVWENSGLQSHQETQNVSPSPERRLCVSAERSPHNQSPCKGPTSSRQEMPSPANFDHKQVPSPQSSRKRYSLSPEKIGSGHEETSFRERSSPSTRRKSPIDQASKRETLHRDDPPKRRLSRSPRKHGSPRRRGRSASKSPTRRRHSPGNRRDHQRSRSRSPIARERNRRSPRRHSLRRRSPPTYHSGRRSPRRPWSPPVNRNTGIGRPGKNLFVAGFNFVTTERDLERKFSKFGPVTDVRIVRDKRSGESRGFGFLSLERDEDADEAIRVMDQTEWNGRIVLVEKSKSSTR